VCGGWFIVVVIKVGEVVFYVGDLVGSGVFDGFYDFMVV